MRTTFAPFSLALLTSPAFAAGPRGQGGVVIRDDAPVYADSTGDKVEWKLKRSEAVAGYLRSWPHPVSYQFEEKNGRVCSSTARRLASAWSQRRLMECLSRRLNGGINSHRILMQRTSRRRKYTPTSRIPQRECSAQRTLGASLPSTSPMRADA